MRRDSWRLNHKGPTMAQHLEYLEAALDAQYDRCSQAMRAYESALSTGVCRHDAVAAGRAVYRESVALLEVLRPVLAARGVEESGLDLFDSGEPLAPMPAAVLANCRRIRLRAAATLMCQQPGRA
jgi:hypothetical protein